MDVLRVRDDEKPTSTFMKSGVPGIIIGVIVLIAICVCTFFLWRNRRRDTREARVGREWNA
ncbi:hypothetical protein ASPWEDRAFT_44886 [Aspergillus wentii DTO 134E9]|uniref:Uncharacterized protein n=1 Tax=Aspergillus wentii DTO 134E9 TaxID=1073089 RepID=A0A1L9R7N1_ASPWE|nr:uncharacterized protein ASPWEDRAFT_44886 [Aspergillus wentii DTO 134E9]KAI9927553.1 hypothetical protein MW887_003171 [Aspergillus wentii]OJJ30930.1 hypothetical protein ASPWEDRAFT_44886 [Aspergillus wentii DTO 134E9]